MAENSMLMRPQSLCPGPPAPYFC